MTKIYGSLSPEVVEFQPGGSPANFEIYVVNKSDQFASFRVELVAAGADPNIGHRWYQLNPEVSAVKPPGDKTTFTVDIISTPIPGLDTINVTVQISSLEFRDIFRLSLRLKIKPGAEPNLLQVDLPVPNRSLYPREQIDIPVRVTNPYQRNVDVILNFTGIEANWLDKGRERRLPIGAGRSGEAKFSCQPPIATRAPSKKYPFQVQAYLQGNLVGSAAGTLEILPVGDVFFSCEPKQHSIPQKKNWFLNWSSKPVIYLLKFKNSSNLFQNIWVNIQSKKAKKFTARSIPEGGNAAPGETLSIQLEIGKKRPWLGLTRKLTLEACTKLSDERLGGKTDPPSKNLELRVHPIVPFWLQLLLSLLILILLLLLPSLLQVEGHVARVNSVSFSGVVDPIVTGSDDQTVRSWSATPERLFCKLFKWQKYCLKPNGILIDDTANGTGEKRVNVLRYRSEKTDQLGVGLENGEIFLWDVNKSEKIDSFIEQKSDRVFALEFSKNSQYLFSGHGGQLWQWDLRNPDRTNSLFKEVDPNRFAIFTLALSQNERTLIIAGRYNKILLGTWDDETQLPKFNTLESYPKGSSGDYITSIATTNNFLVTADTQGYIRLWNLNECTREPNKCRSQDRWQITYSSGRPMPVRSVALTEDGSYLIATGDDGIIRLWMLNTTMKRKPEYFTGKEISKYPTRINSVDAIVKKNRLLIVSGADDYKVRLDTYPLESNE